jgi:putative Holliday junction resolvase
LGGRIALPVEFWDESFTTAQAQASMRARGKKAKEQRQWVDAVAAAFILQDYLDAKKRDA